MHDTYWPWVNILKKIFSDCFFGEFHRLEKFVQDIEVYTFAKCFLISVYDFNDVYGRLCVLSTNR